MRQNPFAPGALCAGMTVAAPARCGAGESGAATLSFREQPHRLAQPPDGLSRFGISSTHSGRFTSIPPDYLEAPERRGGRTCKPECAGALAASCRTVPAAGHDTLSKFTEAPGPVLFQRSSGSPPMSRESFFNPARGANIARATRISCKRDCR